MIDMRTVFGTAMALILVLSITVFPALAQEESSETLVSAKAVIYKNTAVIVVTNSPINVFDVKAIKIVNERGEILKVRVGDGWSYKMEDDFVFVSAQKTLQSGQFVKIGIKTNSKSPIFTWYAYDESDDEIGSSVLRAKVIEKEKAVTPPTRPAPAPEPEKIEVLVDRITYEPGQTVKVSGKGLKNTLAQACLYTSAKQLVFCKSGIADSNGTYRIDLDIPLVISDGTYAVEASQGELRNSVLVTIKVTPKTPTIPVSTAGLTIRTDKNEYAGGDMVRISGVGTANSRVVVTVISPTGENYQLTDEADSSGNYNVLFFTRSTDRSGEWKVTAKQDRNSATAQITFKLIGTTSSSSSTLTVRTDRDTYISGDIVRIFGKATPNTKVTVTVESPDNIRHVLTDNADVNGDYEVSFRTASTDRAGTWNVKAEQSGSTITITFQLRISTTTGGLTLTTDKSTYDRGETVKVTGIGLLNKKVTVVFESPSGARVTFTDIADVNGNYDADLRTIPSDENGEWKITATQEGNSATARATFRLR